MELRESLFFTTCPNLMSLTITLFLLHCVLLGVVRLTISLWFDVKNHKEPWYGLHHYNCTMQLLIHVGTLDVGFLMQDQGFMGLSLLMLLQGCQSLSGTILGATILL